MRNKLKAWRTSVLHHLGFSIAKTGDLDREQAGLRAVIAGVVLLYATHVAFSGAQTSLSPYIAIVCALIVECVGLWQLWWFHRHSERPAWMRFLGIGADLIPLTVGLWGAGEIGVPVIGVYLWVTVGNGFRFGTRYLLAAYWTSLICFAVMVFAHPFWQLHPPIAIGFGLVLAIIPLYVLVLLTRLTAQKDAAVQLSDAKSRFVANVSHELRTPLAGVFAAYDLMRRREWARGERELVGALGSSIATLRASVDAVLQMSKLEAGAEHAEDRPFNLLHLLHQTSRMVQPQAAAKNLSWRLDLDSDVPPTVFGDPEHLQHVLGNLLNNALKFTSVGSVTLRVQRAGPGIRFEVSDTGIGIPLDKQESLFERFVQGDGSATRKFGGTGLGTSIAHDLVKLMGGSIGVYSAHGHGSTFWFELPLVDLARADVPAEWGARQPLLVIGQPDADREGVVAGLAKLGLDLDVQIPNVERGQKIDTSDHLAALLVLPAPDAAVYIDNVFRERMNRSCPLIVVARSFTSTQAAALLKVGVCALLPPTLRPEEWRLHLVALGNRIDLEPIEEEWPTATSTGPLRILLADDHKSNRMLLARILTDAGHSVVQAEGGDQAFDLLAGGNIDVALIDLNMPEMSGLGVVKLYRAGQVGTAERLPIIMMSADATSGARQDSLEAGATDFVVKPCTAVELLGAIEKVAGGTRSLRLPTSPDVNETSHSAGKAAVAEQVSAEAGVTSLLDGERIASLRRVANNDMNFLNQYCDAAFNDLELALTELRRALQSDDVDLARDALHKIDGTAASLGAVALMEGSRQMRNYLSNGLDAEAAAAHAKLVTVCALTKSTVAADLRSELRGSDRSR